MTLLLAVGFVLALVVLVLIRIDYDKVTNLNQGLSAENSRVHSLWNSSEAANARLRKNLFTAKGVLDDIANQNHGDRAFEIWARQRARETLKLVGKA